MCRINENILCVSASDLSESLKAWKSRREEVSLVGAGLPCPLCECGEDVRETPPLRIGIQPRRTGEVPSPLRRGKRRSLCREQRSILQKTGGMVFSNVCASFMSKNLITNCLCLSSNFIGIFLLKRLPYGIFF